MDASLLHCCLLKVETELIAHIQQVADTKKGHVKKKFSGPAHKQTIFDVEVSYTLATVATATLAVHQVHHEPRTPAVA